LPFSFYTKIELITFFKGQTLVVPLVRGCRGRLNPYKKSLSIFLLKRETHGA
jgi:hypothetical protein